MATRSTTYRRDFFKHNKGLFGSIYFCYICKKPLTRRHVEVDHIMPISKFGGTNHHLNLGALCKKCNRKKSNKVDARILLGFGTKAFNLALAVPFVIVGALFSVFKKLDVKIQILVVALLLVYLWASGIISIG